MRDSNPRPFACKANTLPAELIPHCALTKLTYHEVSPMAILADGGRADLIIFIHKTNSIYPIYYEILLIVCIYKECDPVKWCHTQRKKPLASPWQGEK